MEQQFIPLLQGVLEYEKKSLQFMCILFSVAMVIILTFAALRFKKEALLNRIIMCNVVFVVFVAFGVYLITNYRYHQALQLDIYQGSLVTYTGNFVHGDYQRDSFYHNVTIYPEGSSEKNLRYPDYGNQYQLHDDTDIMPVGTWMGTVIYAKNSSVVVYWDGNTR